MQEIIRHQLQEIEKQYQVTILFACETGSRAWGFPSTDSDYDVRFIYQHPKDWYLSINDHKDTITYMQGDLDLVGWDIRKSLHLFRKSNAAMFERIQSPIVYLKRTDFLEVLSTMAPDYFSCRAGLHHYASMALRYYEDCKAQKEVKLKSYFYMLRTTLASLWIVEHQTVPPLQFRKLLPLIEEAALKDEIAALLALKAGVDEKYLHPKEAMIESFVQNALAYCKEKASMFDKKQGAVEPLDDLFRKNLAYNDTHA